MVKVKALLLPVLTALSWPPSAPREIRYRQGRIDVVAEDPDDRGPRGGGGGVLSTRRGITVAEARRHCAARPDCVSFNFESASTRFPDVCSKVTFHRVADWHVGTGTTRFVEDPSWHLWVNATREVALVPAEAEGMLRRLDGLECGDSEGRDGDDEGGAESQRRSLRSAAAARRGSVASSDAVDVRRTEQCVREKWHVLDAIYHLVSPKELKEAAAPLLIRRMIDLSRKGSEAVDVRRAAATNLIVLADSPTTAPLLVASGVFEEMRRIVDEEAPPPGDSSDWEGMPKLALDVVANVVIHGTANPALRRKGAARFLESIRNATAGFPALQSTLALLHLDDEHDAIRLPNATVEELVRLLQSTIDGDVVHGILWDFIPGPLSALQKLVQQRGQRDATVEALLDAGLVEALLRVLEEPCVVAENAAAALEMLQALASASEHAREMIYMAGHSLRGVRRRLEEYRRPARLAEGLTAMVAQPDFVAWQEEL